MNGFLKTAISLVLVVSLIIGVSVFADTFPPEPEVIQVSDPSGWSGDASAMRVVGKTMTLKYDPNTKSAAWYSVEQLENELIEFKAKFNPGDAWVGITIKTNLQGYLPWDMTENYTFLVRAGGHIEFQRQHVDGKSDPSVGTQEFYTNLCDGKEHVVKVGSQTHNNKTYVRFYIDGKKEYEFVDIYPLKTEVSFLQFNCYGSGSQVEVTAMGENEFWDNNPAQMAQPKDTYKEVESEFFMAQSQHNMNKYMIADGKLSGENGKYSYTGSGAINTVDKLDARQFKFKGAVSSSDGSECYADFQFIKDNRANITNYNGYTLRVRSDNTIQLLRYINGVEYVFPAFATGKDLSQIHTYTIKVEKTGAISSLISIWIDDEEMAYRYKDSKYGPNLQTAAFFGVMNSQFTVTSTVEDLEIVGNEEYFADESATNQVILPEYLVEEDGRKMIHWVYATDDVYKGVSIRTIDGKELGLVTFPDNIFVLPDDHKYTQLYAVAIRCDGQEAIKQLVDLTEDRSKYYCEEQKRVIVRPADDEHPTAGFQTIDGEEFIVKGFNYCELRYADHSTFEPAIENVNSADYDPLQAETWLKNLSAYGYNTVRVFLVTGVRREGNRGLSGTDYNGNGIYIPYMENFYDFLNRAQKYGIYTIFNFSENEMITNDYYKKMSGGGNYGQMLLFNEDGMNAKCDYIKLILNYIKERKPSLLNALLAVQAQNEFYFESYWGPWTQLSGTYKYFDGTTFDMGNDYERYALAQHAMKTYYGAIRDAIDEIDPTLMLCEGTFTLDAVGKNSNDIKYLSMRQEVASEVGDSRFPMTIEDYLNSDIDFLDIHIYAGGSMTPEQIVKTQLNTMEYYTPHCTNLRKSKPIILGEYGAYEIPGITLKTVELCNKLQNAALEEGFAGSLFWTMKILSESTDCADGAIGDRFKYYLEHFYVYDKYEK